MLIKCPDCGREVSSDAPRCPKCGCSGERIRKAAEEEVEKSKGCGCVFFAVVIFVILYFGYAVVTGKLTTSKEHKTETIGKTSTEEKSKDASVEVNEYEKAESDDQKPAVNVDVEQTSSNADNDVDATEESVGQPSNADPQKSTKDTTPTVSLQNLLKLNH